MNAHPLLVCHLAPYTSHLRHELENNEHCKNLSINRCVKVIRDVIMHGIKAINTTDRRKLILVASSCDCVVACAYYRLYPRDIAYMVWEHWSGMKAFLEMKPDNTYEGMLHRYARSEGIVPNQITHVVGCYLSAILGELLNRMPPALFCGCLTRSGMVRPALVGSLNDRFVTATSLIWLALVQATNWYDHIEITFGARPTIKEMHANAFNFLDVDGYLCSVNSAGFRPDPRVTSISGIYVSEYECEIQTCLHIPNIMVALKKQDLLWIPFCYPYGDSTQHMYVPLYK